MKKFANLLIILLFIAIGSSTAFACNGDDLCDNPNCEQRILLKKRARTEDPFLQFEPNKRAKNGDQLLEAAKTGNIDVIEMYIQSNDIFYTDSVGRTAYHLAAIHGQLEVVKLLSRTQLARHTDSNRNTPLHSAIDADHIGVAQYIAQVNQSMAEVRNNQGRTPLLLAAQHSSIEYFWTPKLNAALELLIHLGTISDIFDRDYQGKTALDLAWESGKKDAFPALLKEHLRIWERVKSSDQKDQFELLAVEESSDSEDTYEDYDWCFKIVIYGKTGSECMTLRGTEKEVIKESIKVKIKESTLENLDIHGNECPFTGTEGLRLAERISRAFGVQHIRLFDLSSIHFLHDGKWMQQSLRWLHLFQKGTTWYESKGFRPERLDYLQYRGWVEKVRNFDVFQAFIQSNKFEKSMETSVKVENYIIEFTNSPLFRDSKLSTFVDWIWNTHPEDTQKVINSLLLSPDYWSNAALPDFPDTAKKLSAAEDYIKDLTESAAF
jgi:hypothetical protein